MVNEHAKDAIARAKRQSPVDPGKFPAPSAPEEGVMNAVVLPDSVASQIGEANLQEGDVVLYIKSAFLKPQAVANITSRGPNALKDHAEAQPGYFVIAREADIATLIKNMIQEAIDGQS